MITAAWGCRALSAVGVVKLLHQGGDVDRERVLQRADVLLPELGEGADVVAAHDLPVAHHVREVACACMQRPPDNQAQPVRADMAAAVLSAAVPSLRQNLHNPSAPLPAPHAAAWMPASLYMALPTLCEHSHSGQLCRYRVQPVRTPGLPAEDIVTRTIDWREEIPGIDGKVWEGTDQAAGGVPAARV